MKNILDNFNMCRQTFNISFSSVPKYRVYCIIYIFIIIVRSDNFKKIIPGDYFQ